ncbi:hypothetical protein SFC15_19950 [Shouchella clausii]
MEHTKLIGSKTEQELREQLIKSKESLFGSEEKKRLLEVLTNIYPKMNTAYILHWIPEQGENIYKVLIDDNMIAVVELNRYNTKIEPEVQLMPVPSLKSSLLGFFVFYYNLTHYNPIN